ncbi:hypothetical protein MMC17_004196 [Xylographa soralifera]|nr:hypothetical protein [Xylographa soralifera]
MKTRPSTKASSGRTLSITKERSLLRLIIPSESPFVGLGAPDPHKPDKVAGQMVDISDLTKSDMIDFSNGSTTSREVVHKNDGTFVVDEVWSTEPQWLDIHILNHG